MMELLLERVHPSAPYTLGLHQHPGSNIQSAGMQKGNVYEQLSKGKNVINIHIIA